MKQCDTCKITFNNTNFNNDFTFKDSLYFEFKTCTNYHNLRSRTQYQIDNINKIFFEDYHNICCHCKQNKLYTEFNKHINFKSGLDSYCKRCRNEILINNINNHFKQRLRTFYYHVIINFNKSEHIINLLCCDIDFLHFGLNGNSSLIKI